MKPIIKRLVNKAFEVISNIESDPELINATISVFNKARKDKKRFRQSLLSLINSIMLWVNTLIFIISLVD